MEEKRRLRAARFGIEPDTKSKGLDLLAGSANYGTLD
jgi:hypothetical protein